MSNSNIIDAIKTAQSEFQELEDLVNQECSNGISFEALCDKLGGHNEYFSKKYPDTSYFDLNYKSLLVTIKQEINNDNIKEAVTVAKNCVYIYPDNISDTKTYDEMCILDFENKESLKERFTLLEYQLSEEQKTESSISYQRKEKIMDELFNYVHEHTTDEQDYYFALKNIIGLTDYEIAKLNLDVERHLEETSTLKENEITFEDEIIFQDEMINAYIPLYYIDIFEKFGIVEQENTQYDLYLDYNTKEDTCNLIIIEKNDDMYAKYEYEPYYEEDEMLKEKLNEYCQLTLNKTLKEVVEELEEEVVQDE